MVSIACVMCAIDPNMAGLVVPLAQAAIIGAPILLRKQLARGVREVQRRRATVDVDAQPPQTPGEPPRQDARPGRGAPRHEVHELAR
jgi:hypothetical protein